MATASIPLPVECWSLPTANAPQYSRRTLSIGACLTLDFDPTTDETVTRVWTVPQNYASGGTFRLQWAANATTGSVVWAGQIGAITPADADTPFEHAPAAATTATTSVDTTEATRLVQTTITPATDSAAAGDLVILVLSRDANNGSDTASVDAWLVDVSFDYTTT